MRKIALASVAFSAISILSAQAADLPGRAPAVAPAPIFVGMNWTGFYAGVTAGGQWNRASVVHTPTGRNVTTNSDGFTGGVVLGYNRQYGALVAGLEADANLLTNKGTSTATIVFPFTQRVTSQWDARARLRLGYAFDRAMIYAAGGVTMREVSVRLVNSGGAGGEISKATYGWNIGAGVEYALTNNWIARAEYIYDDLSRTGYGFDSLTAGLFADRRVGSRSHTVRAGLSYLFGGPAGPVVAKY